MRRPTGPNGREGGDFAFYEFLEKGCIGLTPELALRRPTMNMSDGLAVAAMGCAAGCPEMLARSRATLWFTVGNGCPLLIPIVCQLAV